MTVATRTSSSAAAPISQLTLGDGIKAALITAGLTTVVDDYTASGSRNIVWSYAVDSTRTYGVIYYRVRIDAALYIYTSLMSGWNTTTKVAINGTNETTWGSINPSYPVNFTALAGLPENALVVVTNNTVTYTLGLFFPVNRPSWWDINFWPWGFCFSAANHSACKSAGLNPYNNQDYVTSLANTNMNYVNDQTKQLDIQPGVMIYTSSSKGIAGRSSDDWIMGCFYGIPPLQIDSIPGSSNLYLIIAGGSGGLAVRVSS